MQIPKFYNPEFMPEKLELAEFILTEQDNEDAKKKVKSYMSRSPLVDMLSNGKVPKPLTKQEADLIINEVTNLKEKISATQKRIADIKSAIDSEVSGKAVDFEINVENNPQVKEAIKKAFKSKSNTITYDMYKAALAAKASLEKEESKYYINRK